MTGVQVDVSTTASSLDVLDGLHHAWCQGCRPDWLTRPRGAELGVPFTAWCGKRAVILTVWQSEDTPPGALCPVCWAQPPPPCAVCGKHLTGADQ